MFKPKQQEDDYEFNFFFLLTEYKKKYPHSSNEIRVDVNIKAENGRNRPQSGRYRGSRDHKPHMVTYLVRH